MHRCLMTPSAASSVWRVLTALRLALWCGQPRGRQGRILWRRRSRLTGRLCQCCQAREGAPSGQQSSQEGRQAGPQAGQEGGQCRCCADGEQAQGWPYKVGGSLQRLLPCCFDVCLLCCLHTCIHCAMVYGTQHHCQHHDSFWHV